LTYAEVVLSHKSLHGSYVAALEHATPRLLRRRLRLRLADLVLKTVGLRIFRIHNTRHLSHKLCLRLQVIVEVHVKFGIFIVILEALVFHSLAVWGEAQLLI
jgi:hypothetical protein